MPPIHTERETAEYHDRVFLAHIQEVRGTLYSYYNQSFLGRGGNGTAFLVTCASGPHMGMQFVLKVFHRISDSDRHAAFLREIEVLRRLDHPAIISIYDDGTHLAPSGRQYPFAVVEYARMTARALLMTNGGALDRIVAVRIALNCLSALKSIHAESPALVHRDIKPENILISDVGAKLADFGLVKTLSDIATDGDGEGAELEVHAGTQWPGMPWRYRTPELVARSRDESVQLTPASDIYQFGSVFYELLTGINPQRRPDTVDSAIVLDIRDIPGAEGSSLERLIRDMTGDRPADRPSAGQCLERLDVAHRAICRAFRTVTGQFH